MELWSFNLSLCAFIFCALIPYSIQEYHNDETTQKSQTKPLTARLFDLIMHQNYSRINYQRSSPYPNSDLAETLIIPNQKEDTHIQKIPRKNSKSCKDQQNESDQIVETEAKTDTSSSQIPGHYHTYTRNVYPIPSFQKPEQFDSDEQLTQQVENIPDQFAQDTEDPPYQINVPDSNSYQPNLQDQHVEENQDSFYQENVQDQLAEENQDNFYQQNVQDQVAEENYGNFYQQNVQDQHADENEGNLYQQNVQDQHAEENEDNLYQQNVQDQHAEENEGNFYQQNVPDQNIEENEDNFYQENVQDQLAEENQDNFYQQNVQDQVAEENYGNFYQQNVQDQHADENEGNLYQQNVQDQHAEENEGNFYQQNVPDQNIEENEDNFYQENVQDQLAEENQDNFYQQNVQDQVAEENYGNFYQQNVQDQHADENEGNLYQQNVQDQHAEENEDNLYQQNVQDQHAEENEGNFYQQNVPDQNIEENEDNFYQQSHDQEQSLHDQRNKLPGRVLQPLNKPSPTVEEQQVSQSNFNQNPHGSNQFHGIDYQVPILQTVYTQSAADENIKYFGQPSSDQTGYSHSKNSYGSYQATHQVNGQNSDTTNNQIYGYLECPKGANGLFPYAFDCKQFLNCWKGRGPIQNCSPGTVFNPQTLGCDYPDKVNCSAYKSQANYFDSEKHPNSYLGKNRNIESSSDQIDDRILNTRSYHSVSQFAQQRNEQNADVFCPKDFIGYKSHPTDCSKYIICTADGVSIETCVLGMKFNSKTGNCDFPKLVDCNNRKNEQLVATGTNIQMGNQNPININSRLNPSSERPNKVPQCPKGLSGLIAHPYNCELFLNCANGQTFVQKCGPGTVFNPTILSCDYPYNVDCQHKSEPIVNPNIKPKPTSTPNPYPLPRPTPDPNLNPDIDVRALPQTYLNQYNKDIRSGKYVENKWKSVGKDSENIRFNEKFQSGKTQDLSLTSRISKIQNIPQCPKSASGLIPHPTECDSYLNCNNGQTVIQKCGPGTVFNPKIFTCDFPYNVNCQESEVVTEPNVDPNIDVRIASSNQHQYTDHFRSWKFMGNEHAHGEFQYGQRIGPLEFHTSSSRVTEQRENKPQCPNGVSGLIPHPTECDSFLNCNNGQTFVQKCGPGTLFNPETNACDFPYNVDCHQTEAIIQPHVDPNIDVRVAPKTKLLSSSQIIETNWKPVQQIGDQEKHTHNHHHKHESWNHDGFEHSEKFHRNQHHHTQGSSGTTWTRVGHTAGHHRHNGSYGLWHGHQNHHSSTVPTIETTSTEATTKSSKEREELDLWYKFVNTRPNKNDLDGAHSNTFGHSSVDYGRNEYAGVKGGDKILSTTESYISLTNEKHKTLLQTFSQVKPTPKPPKKSNCFPHKFECSPDMCLSFAFVCDGFKHCPNGIDEENCKNTMKNVIAHKGNRLVRHDVQKWFSVTLDKCAQYCENSRTFVCKSFNYRASDGECVLSDEVVGQTGDMEQSYQFDFYEMKNHVMNCDMKYTCDNLKCIELHEACNGVNNCGDNSDEKYCSTQKNEFGVRLVGSKNMNEGRLEVKAFGRWGTVCDDKFSLLDAEVACKELGYPLGAVQVLHNPLYFTESNNVQNPNNTLILMDEVDCLGNETSLKDCKFNGWGVHNCKPDEVVGLVCKTSTVTCPKDYWLCAVSMECIPLAFLCDHVEDCVDKSDESSSYCEAKTELRLANGSTPLEGRVEIRFYGVWGTICDDDFTNEAATVVCNQLGYHGPAEVRKGGMYGSGSGPIWLDQVSCFGNESSVEKCLHNERGQHNCEHSEDVGVVCSRTVSSGIKNGYRGIYKPSIPRTVIHKNDLELDDVLPTTCGIRDEDSFTPDNGVAFRVVAGSIAKKGHYPWQASLRVKGQSKTSHWCGGVIITRLHVLTAAHCLIGFSKSIYVIRAGDYESEVDEGTEQEAYIEEFYLHESFRKGHHMNNDIAIIKLKGDGFNLDKHVQPICLPDVDTDYVPNKNCTISGWGSTQSGKLSAALQLRAGWIPIQSDEICRKPEVYGDSIKEGMFCAGSLDEGVDSCDGDSGGPLACLDNGFFTLFGITSWGQHCGYANKPGVYVKIGHYRKWIDDVIKKSL